MSTAHHDARATMFGLVHRPAHYRRFADRLAGRFYRRVVADVAAEVASSRLADGARVLDAGTGPGTVPLLLAEACPQLRIDAIDLAPEMIAEAAERGRAANSPVVFTMADVGALPFDDATFDLVVSTVSQHHWTDPEAGFRDIVRVLRPGGQAWVYDVRSALGRAEIAALRAVAPGARAADVRRESPLSDTAWWYPMGRVVVRRVE